MDSMIACNTLETFHILLFDLETMCLIFLIVINAVDGAMDGEVTPDATRKSHWITSQFVQRSGSGGLHRLRTTLHSARLPNLHKLFNECEQLIVAHQEQRLRSIVLNVCCKRLFFQYVKVPTPPLNLHDASSKCFSTTKGQIKLGLLTFYITN